MELLDGPVEYGQLASLCSYCITADFVNKQSVLQYLAAVIQKQNSLILIICVLFATVIYFDEHIFKV